MTCRNSSVEVGFQQPARGHATMKKGTVVPLCQPVGQDLLSTMTKSSAAIKCHPALAKDEVREIVEKAFFLMGRTDSEARQQRSLCSICAARNGASNCRRLRMRQPAWSRAAGQ